MLVHLAPMLHVVVICKKHGNRQWKMQFYGPSWDLLRAILGLSWGPLGAILGPLRASWGILGGILEPLRALLGSSWGLMCRIVEKLEGFYYFWEVSWGILVENVEKLNTFDHFKGP